jgi:hypothetical protein
MRNKSIFIFTLFFWITIPFSVSAVSVPEITEEEKTLAITGITDYYEGVREALISQKGKKINLTIIVKQEISEIYARQLGDNFVRLVKLFSKDKSPGRDIGPGIYDYLIAVYYPNRKLVAVGEKGCAYKSITW